MLGDRRIADRWTPEELEILGRFVPAGSLVRRVRGKRMKDLEVLLPKRTRDAIEFKLVQLRREKEVQRGIVELLGECVRELRFWLRVLPEDAYQINKEETKQVLRKVGEAGFLFCNHCGQPVGVEGVCNNCHHPVGGQGK